VTTEENHIPMNIPLCTAPQAKLYHKQTT